MGRYDDAQISEVHRAALEARLAVLRRRPDLRKSALISGVRAAFGEEDCGSIKSESDILFQVAREAYESGDPDEGASLAQLATESLNRYNDCLLHDSLAPPDDFVFE